MASVRQGKHLPSILHLFYLNCVFPESPEEGANASYFFSLFFQLYRVPPGHNSFLVSFPFLPSALGLVSIGGKHPQSPSEAKSCRCFSPLRTWPEAGHSASLPAPGCTAGRGAKLLFFCFHICAKEMFSGLTSSTKGRKSLGSSSCNTHFSSLLEVWGRRGKTDSGVRLL